MNQRLEKNLVPMIMKTFEVLEVFRERPRGLTYMELVERYPRISRVSLYRILCSLDKLGYLRKDERTNRYELGTKFIELGRITEARQDIVRIAHPFMEKVLNQFGETVNLARIQSKELVYLSILEGWHPLRLFEIPNRQQAIYCSGVGKAIMAFMTDEQRDELLDKMELKPLTANTITDKKRLLEELESIRVSGFSEDHDENIIGVSCVAVPILNGQGRAIAGMSVTGPTARNTPAKLIEIGTFLKNVAMELSREHFGLSENVPAAVAK
ncbi:IclR family transcriptional regulator [bacterium]|nr:IclR family transcriptional regulator [bacterium]